MANAEEDIEIVFLTYLNRSGSTYLASRLNECEGIQAGIEARFVDGWITPGFSIRDDQELVKYLDNLFADDKFQAWKVSRKELTAVLSSLEFPLRFSEVLLAAHSLSTISCKNCRIILHKCGEYYRCVEKIRSELPQAKFIFVHRDPQAIFSSQRRSMDSRTGQPMLQDVLHFAFGYIDTWKRVAALRKEPYFFVVQYEDLVASEEKTITEVTRFLGISYAVSSGRKNNYMQAVPDAQQHLHQEVQRGRPNIQRVDGWKKELPASDVLFLQVVLRKYLHEVGFKRYYPPRMSMVERGRFLKNLFLYVYEFWKRRIFRIEHHY
jgi:hypothetical protein